MRGFIFGLFWGAALSGAMVLVATEMAVEIEIPDGPTASGLDLPAGSGFDGVRSDLPPEAPGTVAERIALQDAPAVLAPDTDRGNGMSVDAPAMPTAEARPPQAVVGGLGEAAGPDIPAIPTEDARPGLAGVDAFGTLQPDAIPTIPEPVTPPAAAPGAATNAGSLAVPEAEVPASGAGGFAPEQPVTEADAQVFAGADTAPDLPVAVDVPGNAPQVAGGIDFAAPEAGSADLAPRAPALPEIDGPAVASPSLAAMDGAGALPSVDLSSPAETPQTAPQLAVIGSAALDDPGVPGDSAPKAPVMADAGRPPALAPASTPALLDGDPAASGTFIASVTGLAQPRPTGRENPVLADQGVPGESFPTVPDPVDGPAHVPHAPVVALADTGHDARAWVEGSFEYSSPGKVAGDSDVMTDPGVPNDTLPAVASGANPVRHTAAAPIIALASAARDLPRVEAGVPSRVVLPLAEAVLAADTDLAAPPGEPVSPVAPRASTARSSVVDAGPLPDLAGGPVPDAVVAAGDGGAPAPGFAVVPPLPDPAATGADPALTAPVRRDAAVAVAKVPGRVPERTAQGALALDTDAPAGLDLPAPRVGLASGQAPMQVALDDVAPALPGADLTRVALDLPGGISGTSMPEYPGPPPAVAGERLNPPTVILDIALPGAPAVRETPLDTTGQRPLSRAPRPNPRPIESGTATESTVDSGAAPAAIAQVQTPAEAARERVQTGRLPQAGRPAPNETDEAAAATEDPAVPADALSRNAAEFDAAAGLPVLSVVLLDGGDVPLNLPFQATFALDPSSPEAVLRAGIYRASGHEIVALPALPGGASARDAANALAGSAALLDQAVAILDSPDGLLQKNRAALGEFVAEAAGTGHALLTFAKGLNSAQREAERAGVVTGAVFRDIDGAGQDRRAVKRFLDQAAFRARQEGAIIVFARVRPETVQALTEWVQGNRAQSVSLAPVSVALRGRAGL